MSFDQFVDLLKGGAPNFAIAAAIWFLGHQMEVQTAVHNKQVAILTNAISQLTLVLMSGASKETRTEFATVLRQMGNDAKENS